jgi:acyl-[acyl-carrier-protein]-phospholipid O-acyltransferase/long-chain-fatty-acid--[acyl-carrier-protein] ligase
MTDGPLDRAEYRDRVENLPAVRRDVSFWGMTFTQFLGAFNDNLFKQLVLLFCTDLVREQRGGPDYYQTLASAFFSLPFVLFSGFAGYLSDLHEKRTVVIWCKVAEIVVMLAGTAAFFAGDVRALIVVLFMMGAQSAFFGPSKFGILPEMFRSRDLPYVNGVFIMTTFLAIILGTALAGPLKDSLGNKLLWVTSLACVATAIIGTATSFLVRHTPVANPYLQFRLATLAIDRQTWTLIRRDKPIRNVLYITSIFWMIGGVIQMASNAFGKYQLAVSDTRTSTMLVGVAVGIAVGCVIAGRLSNGQIKFGLYRLGNFVVVAGLMGLGTIGLLGPNFEREIIQAEKTVEAKSLGDESISTEQLAQAQATIEKIKGRSVDGFEWVARALLLLTGVGAGLFTVPMQTFLQVRPPDDEKGRVIAAMNLFNWIGILLASATYFAFSSAVYQFGWPQAVQFFFCAAVMMLLYLYRLDDSGRTKIGGRGESATHT